ncbi:DUF6030 family protein [Rhizobium sp. TRM95111]|uniref:DUF6030 family protein n=1 Tax=Rhizobium alarense TaxID=2846851 RepID=UPI001F1F8707|nr:DUF6030 family protein [Rhizobium alarense]MCF3639387.1 DUF6030 family protein [Rhizobium alarense]
MTDGTSARSGKGFFIALSACLVLAILATFLLANDYRNLNHLLVRTGFDPISTSGDDRELRPYELRGNRIPRPKVAIPDRLISRIVPMETKFKRAIRRDPKDLCEALRRTGFASSGWREGGFAAGSWECSSYREFPTDREGTRAPTSAYLAIRGNQETRITSFRIKLNVENRNTLPDMTGAVLAAIRTFLDEVRWEEAPDILANIESLTEFDIIRFGNRIQLKREFSETPRYNFLITPDRTRPKNTYIPDYFNRSLWLPLPEELRGPF